MARPFNPSQQYPREGQGAGDGVASPLRVRALAVLAAFLLPLLLALPCALGSEPPPFGSPETRAVIHGSFASDVPGWTAAAEAGDADAALMLGVAAENGFGVPRDYTQARLWYEKAAQGGNVTALFNLGVIYDSGRGLAPDHARAAQYYAAAAARGFGRAQYRLALMMMIGDGVALNPARARSLFAAAAANGVAAARPYLRGGAVPPDANAAVAAIRPPPRAMRADGAAAAAATDGAAFAAAQRAMATGDKGGMARGAAAFRRAAEAGDPLAAYDLGYCFETGCGGAIDHTAALRWYGEAMRHARDPQLRDLARAARDGLVSRDAARR